MKTIFAIDPGPTESAVVIYEAHERRILRKDKLPNDQVLRLVSDLHPVDVTVFAIEMIASFGMAVGKEVFETCVWIGRFVERAQPLITARLVYRMDVKMHLCHTTRAKDPNIRQALIDKLGAPGTKKNPGGTYGVSGDCWSALAVAVTAAETFGVLASAGS